jgi:hypothetical protein
VCVHTASPAPFAHPPLAGAAACRRRGAPPALNPLPQQESPKRQHAGCARAPACARRSLDALIRTVRACLPRPCVGRNSQTRLERQHPPRSPTTPRAAAAHATQRNNRRHAAANAAPPPEVGMNGPAPCAARRRCGARPLFFLLRVSAFDPLSPPPQHETRPDICSFWFNLRWGGARAAGGRGQSGGRGARARSNGARPLRAAPPAAPGPPPTARPRKVRAGGGGGWQGAGRGWSVRGFFGERERGRPSGQLRPAAAWQPGRRRCAGRTGLARDGVCIHWKGTERGAACGCRARAVCMLSKRAEAAPRRGARTRARARRAAAAPGGQPAARLLRSTAAPYAPGAGKGRGLRALRSRPQGRPRARARARARRRRRPPG